MDHTLQAVLAAMSSFFLVSLIVFTILVVCECNSKRHRIDSSISRDRTRNRGRTRSRTVPKTEFSSIAVGESATFDPTLNRISMRELIDATRNFSSDLIIGDGSFGLVYKAQLNSGVVAVKKLAADAFQGFREFRAEMETLGKIRHSNIVQILGYCATGRDRVLIYEYIEKGSLDQWLYDTSSSLEEDGDEVEIRSPLSWDTRIKIIRGVAEGLAYMHNLDTPIIHRDIKASNVLLDPNFEAHIADFGLARRIEGPYTHVSTQVAGTMGYMPPEYMHGATMATVMGDVYSFGVLMLEIVTGRRPSFPFAGESGKEVRLMEWVNKMVEQKRYMEMVDVSISKDGLKENTVMEIFQIGLRCAGETCKFRPTMKEVVEELDKISSRNLT
ncbi:Protein kinase superfamily protein [Abeliophyllum distichum]|uniref:Protein kinase superfamily protein n=1 Tax=Abeliophyllum distichum TaxID=126358 RepID=A0ABD1SSS2_9LAMI